MSLLKGKQLTSPVYLTGSLFGTASYAVTASYALSGPGGGGGTPGGSDTQIQYNNNNTFAGVPVLTYSGSILRATGSFSGSFTGLINSASYAATASLAPDYLPLSGGSVVGDLTVTGNTEIILEVNATNITITDGNVLIKSGGETNINNSGINTDLAITASAFSGPLFGTASWAQNSLTASYVNLSQTASFVTSSNVFGPYGRNSVVSASYSISASQAANSLQLNGSSSNVFATVNENTFNGNQTINGNVTINGTGSIAYLNVSFESASVIYSSGSNQFGDNVDDVQSLFGSVLISGSLQLTGSANLPNVTGSLFGTASWSQNSVTASYYRETDPIFVAKSASLATTGSNIFIGNQTITGSINLTGSLNQIGDYTHTGNVNHSGSKFLNGIFVQTGSLSITGSTTQIGNNTLAGNTILSGSIIISGSTTVPATPTIKIYGDMETDGVIKFMPVSKNIDTSISASYIYVSGSTNDLYFSQNGSGYNNVTRLRWLEGNLYTGLLHGGLITTQSNTVYQIQSGSGIIVNLNASQTTDPYPTIQYLNWGTLSASIAPLSASFDQSFVSINSSGQIYAQGIPYVNGDYNEKIPIGNVIHQNRSSINATATYPSLGYGWKQRSSDFIRAFGPLKLSGLDVAVSSSAGTNSTGSLIITSGTSFNDGRNYTENANNPSYVEDNGTTVSKIYKYYQSGSNGWGYLTAGGAGYGAIDPTQYSNNGVLTALTGTGANREWTIQRVYWFTGGATKGIYVYYGNAYYVSKADAIANINIEPFIEAPNTRAGAVLAGYLILRNDANFTVPTSYQIIPSGLFRNVGGSGGGGSVVTQTLSGLSDVLISGQTNGQPLVYDAGVNRWINSSTLTASLHGSADTATTASYALTASHAPNYVLIAATASMLAPYVLTSSTSSMTVLSASYAETASLAPNYLLLSNTSSMLAPYVLTSSTSSMTVGTANTASFVTASNVFGPFGSNSILSSSYALTASYALSSAGGGGSGAGFPFSGSAVITGSLLVSGSGLTVTGSLSVTGSTSLNYVNTSTYRIDSTTLGTTIIATIATGSNTSAFVNYTINSGVNARAGQFMAVWNGTTTQYTDVSTLDVGDTSAINFTASIVSSNLQISEAGPAGWSVKMLVNLI